MATWTGEFDGTYYEYVDLIPCGSPDPVLLSPHATAHFEGNTSVFVGGVEQSYTDLIDTHGTLTTSTALSTDDTGTYADADHESLTVDLRARYPTLIAADDHVMLTIRGLQDQPWSPTPVAEFGATGRMIAVVRTSEPSRVRIATTARRADGTKSLKFIDRATTTGWDRLVLSLSSLEMPVLTAGSYLLTVGYPEGYTPATTQVAYLAIEAYFWSATPPPEPATRVPPLRLMNRDDINGAAGGPRLRLVPRPSSRRAWHRPFGYL